MKFICLFLVLLTQLFLAPLALADHSSSLLAEDTFMKQKGWATLNDDCFSTNKLLLDLSQTNNSYIPPVFSEAELAKVPSQSSNLAVIATAKAAAGAGLMALATTGIGALVAAIAAAVLITNMMDLCSNAFILPAYEIANWDAHCLRCSPFDSSQFLLTYPHALGPEDIPYRYHCDQSQIDTLFSRGYGGWFNDKLCNGTNGYAKHRWSSNLGLGHDTDPATPGANGHNTDSFNSIRICFNSYARKMWYGIRLPTGLPGGGPTGYQFCSDTTNGINPSDSTGDQLKYCWEQSPGTDYSSGWMVYYANNSGAGIQLCAANYLTLFPIFVGCETVAPPVEATPPDQGILTYLNPTRCLYFAQGRTDLYQLGLNLPTSDSTALPVGTPPINRYGVKAFLMGDLHFFSTITGCFQDLLLKVFDASISYNNANVMYNIHKSLAALVYAAMTLSIAIYGSKIIMAAEPPKYGDAILQVLKYSLVFGFSTGTVWYSGNGGIGLYATLLNASQMIGSIFMNAAATTDPINRCLYNYGPLTQAGWASSNMSLLGGMDIPATTASSVTQIDNTMTDNGTACSTNAFPFTSVGAMPPPKPFAGTGATANCGGAVSTTGFVAFYVSKVADPNGCGPDTQNGHACQSNKNTAYSTYSGPPNVTPPAAQTLYQTYAQTSDNTPGGSCVVRLTVWDMVDCRLGNIANLGMCKYNIASLFLLWLVPISIFDPNGGFLMAISAALLLSITFSVILKITMIYILSWFAITILCVTAPVFLCFALFEKTKQMYTQWLKYLIAYMLYPGLLFAYIALIFATMNVVMFGNIPDVVYNIPTSSTDSTPIYPAGTDLASVDWKLVCADPGLSVNSAFCATYNVLGSDPCGASDTDIANSFLTNYQTILFSRKILNPNYSTVMKPLMLKLMLFSFLFMMFSKGVLGFMSQLCGLQGLAFEEETAMLDNASIAGAAKGYAKFASGKAMAAAKSAYSKVQKAKGKGGGGGGGGKGGGGGG